jgi:hypothetical protein
MSRASTIRADLIARLRATGTMSPEARPARAISAIEAKDPTVIIVARLIDQRSIRGGVRWLAPSDNQMVLP